MSTKKKIIISVCALVLVVVAAVIGVLAANSQSVTIRNRLTFSASGVVGSITAQASYYDTSETTSTPITISPNAVSFTTEETTQNKTLTIPAQTFTGKTDTITYTFIVHNGGTGSMTVQFTPADLTDKNLNATAYNYQTSSNAIDYVTVTPTANGSIQEYTILSGAADLYISVTISIADAGLDVGADLNWEFNLTA